MPYKLKKFGRGYKVTSPGHKEGFSKKPLTRRQAYQQLKAIFVNTGGK